jgi:hypothetical protein
MLAAQVNNIGWKKKLAAEIYGRCWQQILPSDVSRTS